MPTQIHEASRFFVLLRFSTRQDVLRQSAKLRCLSKLLPDLAAKGEGWRGDDATWHPDICSHLKRVLCYECCELEDV